MTPLTGSVASRIAIAGLFPRFVAPMGTAPAGRSIPVAGNDTEAPRQAVASVTARRIPGFVVHRNRRKTTADVVPGRLPAAPDPYVTIGRAAPERRPAAPARGPCDHEESHARRPEI